MNDIKTNFVINFFQSDCSELIGKYANADSGSEGNKIGNRAWMFWNTGFDNAPPVVKRCSDRIKEIDNIDVVLLDSQNLYDYTSIDPMLIEKYEKGEITIQLFSDIIRNNLLSTQGGFWVDATGLILDKDYINKHKDLPFYTAKHNPKTTLHFVKGLWSGFMIGSGKNNPMTTFANDFFIWYFSKYDNNFDYFFIDYVYLLAYRCIPAVKEQVDSVKLENENVFDLWQHFYKRYSEEEWQEIKEKNIFQKMIWKINPKKVADGCFYKAFTERKGCSLS